MDLLDSYGSRRITSTDLYAKFLQKLEYLDTLNYSTLAQCMNLFQQQGIKHCDAAMLSSLKTNQAEAAVANVFQPVQTVELISKPLSPNLTQKEAKRVDIKRIRLLQNPQPSPKQILAKQQEAGQVHFIEPNEATLLSVQPKQKTVQVVKLKKVKAVNSKAIIIKTKKEQTLTRLQLKKLPQVGFKLRSSCSQACSQEMRKSFPKFQRTHRKKISDKHSSGLKRERYWRQNEEKEDRLRLSLLLNKSLSKMQFYSNDPVSMLKKSPNLVREQLALYRSVTSQLRKIYNI